MCEVAPRYLHLHIRFIIVKNCSNLPPQISHFLKQSPTQITCLAPKKLFYDGPKKQNFLNENKFFYFHKSLSLLKDSCFVGVHIDVFCPFLLRKVFCIFHVDINAFCLFFSLEKLSYRLCAYRHFLFFSLLSSFSIKSFLYRFQAYSHFLFDSFRVLLFVGFLCFLMTCFNAIFIHRKTDNAEKRFWLLFLPFFNPFMFSFF